MPIGARLAALAFTCAAGAAAFAGCGSDGGEQFAFTPVPYTVFPEAQCESISCSRSYYLTDTCEWNAADQVQLVVLAEQRNSFVNWMSDHGFIIQEEYNRLDDNTVVMLIVVPAGSVPDAVEVIREQPGIVLANANGLVFPPEEEPAFIVDCRKTHEAEE